VAIAAAKRQQVCPSYARPHKERPNARNRESCLRVAEGERVVSSIAPRLFYFRHGETAWSLTGRHTGVTDTPLTVRGESQARALAPWTAAISFAHVFTSPRLRARVTCELAGLGAKAKVEPDLAEWNYGDFEGLRTVDIWKGSPGWDIFRDGCPNGEQAAAIGARVDRRVARLSELDSDVALFAHGQLGSVFVA
jgi:probable phosphoglycerate mutase